MQKIILYIFISLSFFGCGEIETNKSNHALLGYWGSWSPNTRDLEEILYFGEAGTACSDLTDYYSERNHNIPNFEELQCANRLIRYKIIDKGVVMIEGNEATFKVFSNDEIHFTINGEKFKLFRISKYQAIKES